MRSVFKNCTDSDLINDLKKTLVTAIDVYYKAKYTPTDIAKKCEITDEVIQSLKNECELLLFGDLGVQIKINLKKNNGSINFWNDCKTNSKGLFVLIANFAQFLLKLKKFS